MPQPVGAEDRDIAWGEAASQAVHEGVCVGDESAADVDVGHDLGDGIDSSPNEGALIVAPDIGYQFIELEKGAAQAPKE